MNQEFFEKVLPTQGNNYCVLGIKKIPKGDKEIEIGIPRFFSTLQQAMKQMETFDNDPKCNTFFALGKFEGERRKATGCMFLKSFFVDLDCGPTWIDEKGEEHSKPYETKAEALTALREFIDNTGMPQPIVVDSGRGVHAYWPLTEDIPKADWVPLARHFMEFCLANNLPLDTDVTADAARILRVPGSYHRKGEPRLTKILLDADPVDLAEIVAVIGEPEVKFELSMVEKGLDEDTKALLDKKNDNYEFVFEKLAKESLEGNGCEQIKHIIVHAASCPEPLWYAGISVAVRCVDGDTAIHKISEDYPGYSYEETERKANQSLNEASWAHGCDAFARENPNGCKGCPHYARIAKAGPIMLARQLKLDWEPEELQEPEDSEDDEPTDDTPTEPQYEQYQPEQYEPSDGEDAPESETGEVRANKDTKESLKFPDYLAPFYRPKNGGVYYLPPPKITKTGKKVQEDPQVVTPHDLIPIQRLFSPHDGECLLMELRLPRDGKREFLLPLKHVTAQDKLKATLAYYGVVFEPNHGGSRLASYLMKWTDFLMHTQKADIMRHQQGWTEDHESFVLGTQEIFKNEIRNSPPSPMARNVVRYIKPEGTFESWLESARMFGDPGYEFHAFAMLCGFATPLLEFTSINGVVVSLYGESGTGKTGALYGAMSIWGSPEELSVNDGTPNGLTQRMITSKNITFGLDEQSNLDGKTASDMAYKTSAGRPKIRLQASSNQEREAEFITRLITLMTTNTSLPDLISTYKANTTAEEMRILEPTIMRPNTPGYELTAERGLQMFDNLKRNYGHAGTPYIQHLLQHGKSNLRTFCTIEHNRMTERFTTSAEFRFLVNLYAVVSVAYRMTNELGWFDWDIERIFKVVGADLDKFIARKKLADSDTREDILGDFISKNIQNILVVNDGVAKMTPRGPLFVRAEVDNGLMYVSTRAMRDYLHSINMGVKEFEARLTKAGVMEGHIRKKMAAGWNEAIGSTNVQAYIIRTDISEILQLDQEDAEKAD